MRNMKLILALFCCIGGILTGCVLQNETSSQGFEREKSIIALSRERGSGTRISFLNLLGVDEESLLQSPDNTISSTEVMLLAVESDPYAIGYVSNSQLPSGVKALTIDELEFNGKNIENNKYPLTRNFYLLTGKENSKVVIDFIDFITSSQDIIKENGYTPIVQGSGYTLAQSEGKITVSGSSSVYPLMENLIDEYKVINPKVEIEINQTDSSNGIKNLSDGIVDIAMSSRELTTDEQTQTKQFIIAKDTIAVIVHEKNPINNLSLNQLNEIYIGKASTWKDVE